MTASTVGTGTCLAAKGLDISLAALKRQDPYINNIVDVASQVALYTFSNRANEWEKTDVEGTLFVYTRLASPRHGFTIMNRLSMDNLTEPITKDLDFQLQDPFLLYRNARLSIYGIWFYDKEDCLRIAELMKNLTRQEQLLAQQGGGVSPRALRAEEGKGVDILQMLTKARNEYDKGKPSSEPKEIASSSSVIYDNPHLIKPIPVKPLERPQGVQQGQQVGDSEPRHLSLAALFGVQSRPDHMSPQAGSGGGGRPAGMRPMVARSLSYEEPSRPGPPQGSSPPQHCPAIQKLMSTQRGPAELLQRVSESPENRLCENGAPQPAHHCQGGRDPLHRLFQNAPPTAAPPCCTHGPSSLQQAPPPLLHGLQAPQPDLGVPLHPHHPHQQAAPRPLFFSPGKAPQLAPPSQVTGVVSPHELLQRLQLVQQEQNLNAEPPACPRSPLPGAHPAAPPPAPACQAPGVGRKEPCWPRAIREGKPPSLPGNLPPARPRPRTPHSADVPHGLRSDQVGRRGWRLLFRSGPPAPPLPAQRGPSSPDQKPAAGHPAAPHPERRDLPGYHLQGLHLRLLEGNHYKKALKALRGQNGSIVCKLGH
ncbi:hypothetical protein AGOR_G00185620 [Albula goreensis]|uniref:5'-(N(7)-methylguanosine 5'-triphospho)-[mRNA] hydrolase n=1 Tax=Albula goreensis TaxID=1534307 RepID=A0A8T3CYS2_9TELE|nr:hypothetical protein AGOR_G00185620 [Albula goreensis]